MAKKEYSVDLTYVGSLKEAIRRTINAIEGTIGCSGTLAALDKCISKLPKGSSLFVIIDDEGEKIAKKALDFLEKKLGKNVEIFSFVMDEESDEEFEGNLDLDFEDDDEFDYALDYMKKGRFDLHYLDDDGKEAVKKNISLDPMSVRDFIYGILDDILKKENSKHDFIYLEHKSSKEKYFNDGIFKVIYKGKDGKSHTKKIGTACPYSLTDLKEEIKDAKIDLKKVTGVEHMGVTIKI